MTKKEAKHRVLIFVGMITLPTILWWILSVTGIAKHLDYDTGEKREKHEISEDVNAGNLTSELESYYNDRVPFRSILLSVDSGLGYASELPYTKIVEPLLLKMVNGKVAAAAEEEPEIEATDAVDEKGKPHEFEETLRVDATYDDPGFVEYVCSDCGYKKTEKLPMLVDVGYFPLKMLSPDVIQGRNEWLFFNKTMEDYQGTNMQTEEEYAAYVETLNTLKQSCDTYGKELYVLCVPNKNSVYPECMPSVDAAEKRNAQYLEEYIHANSSVKYQYVFEEMLAAKKDHRLYYKYDTHWNDYGSSVAINTLFSMMGRERIDVNSLTVKESVHGESDLAELAALPYENYTDAMPTLIYNPEVRASLHKEGDLDGIVHFTTNSENQKNVVVFGDSFRIGTYDLLPMEFSNVTYVNYFCIGDVDPALVQNADIIIFLSVERNIITAQGYYEIADYFLNYGRE